jgi:hypothetical protein
MKHRSIEDLDEPLRSQVSKQLDMLEKDIDSAQLGMLVDFMLCTGLTKVPHLEIDFTNKLIATWLLGESSLRVICIDKDDVEVYFPSG